MHPRLARRSEVKVMDDYESEPEYRCQACEELGWSGDVGWRTSCDLGVCGLVEQEDYVGALYNAAGREALNLIYEWLDEDLPGIDLPELLEEAWLNLSISYEFPAEDVVELFRQAGFVSDSKWVSQPTNTMTVYRGCAPDEVERPSWSVSRGIACWYADHQEGAHVYAAEIPPEDVLAIYLGRCSREVVVDPNGLRNVREIGRPKVIISPPSEYDEQRELRALGIRPTPRIRITR
jgi:hypothetical protein